MHSISRHGSESQPEYNSDEFVQPQSYSVVKFREQRKRGGFMKNDLKSLDEPWVLNLYRRFLHDKDRIRALIVSGMLQPNSFDDWLVDRNQITVSTRLGIRSFSALMSVLGKSLPTQRISLELGPGDGTLSNDLFKACPDWFHLSLGDRLYFSLEKLLSQFVRENVDDELEEFIRIFFLFIKREFVRRTHTSVTSIGAENSIDLNEVYKLLKQVPDWILKYYDMDSGKYSVSMEFEYDVELYMSAKTRMFFNSLLCGDLGLYSRLFSPVFHQLLLKENGESNIDLNNYAPIHLKGFMCGKFEDIFEHLSKKYLVSRVTLFFGSRSDSHLPSGLYYELVDDILDLLSPGGVYLSDGVRQSYSRVLRFEGVLNILKNRKGEPFRAFAVCESKTGRPLSLYLERGRYDRKNRKFRYISDEDLSEIFDFSEVQLISLDQIIRSERVENALRKDLLDLFEGDTSVFYGRNDLIHQAACLLKSSISPIDLLRHPLFLGDGETSGFFRDVILDFLDISKVLEELES